MAPSPESGRQDPPDATLRPRNGLAQILAVATGGLAVAGIFVLVGLGRLEPAEGLPWIAATLSGLAHLRGNDRRR